MIGSELRPYRILSELGRGGMGVVYEAEDTKLKRRVAIKFLPDSTNSKASARFMAEAQSAAALDHNNICAIHQVAETEDGRPYIVMALYEGQSLEERLEAGPIDPVEARDLFIQASAGLAAAHKAGIIHRDIKPANIFVTDENVVKILDFGIARMEGQDTITAEGSTLGTTAYMSPEQARGESVTPATDIWSLGVVLYEMLAGKRPFDTGYPQATIYSILNEDPAELPQDISGDLKKVVANCLDKDASKRVQNGANLADILTDEKIATPEGAPVATSGNLGSWIPWAAVAVIAAVALVWLKPFSGSSIDPAELKLIVLPFEDESPSRSYGLLARGLAQDITGEITIELGIPTLGNATAKAYAGFAPLNVAQETGVDFIVTGSFLQDGNSATVFAELANPQGVRIWGDSFSGDPSSLQELRNNLIAAIADHLGISFESVAKQWDDAAYRNMLTATALMWTEHTDSALAALPLFLEAIEIEPTMTRAHAGYMHAVGIYTEQKGGPPSDAISMDEMAHKAWEADSTSVYSLLTKTLVGTSMSSRFQFSRQTLLADSLNFDVQFYAGFNFMMMGDAANMIHHLKKAVELDPSNTQPMINIFAGYALSGQPSEAKRTFDDACPTENPHPYCGLITPWNLALRNAPETQVVESLRAIKPDSPEFFIYMGSISGGYGYDETMRPLIKESIGSGVGSPVAEMIFESHLGSLDRAFDIAFGIIETNELGNDPNNDLLYLFMQWHNYLTSDAFKTDPRFRELQLLLDYPREYLN